MKDVKLLVPRAGVGFSNSIGDVIPVGDDEAERMIKAKHGIYVESRVVNTETEKSFKKIKKTKK
tara:strand:+ start:5299 stop:5490 length:192 start_codon:yes stop_codon:yes gene_type:complete